MRIRSAVLTSTAAVAAVLVAAPALAASWGVTGAGTAASKADGFPTVALTAPAVSVSSPSVNINFGPVSSSGGVPASSYLIQGYATASGGSPTRSFGCVRAAATPNCTDAPGLGTTTFYSYTPKLGTNWIGVESARSSGAVVPGGLTVTSVSPTARGQNSAQTTLTVNGTGFAAGSAISLSGTATGVTLSSTSFVSSTQLTAQITLGASAAVGQRTVVVTNPGPVTGTCTNCFTVTPAPTVASVTPTTLARNGAQTAVSVTGTGFVTGFTPTISGSSNYQVISSSFTSATTITVTIKNNNTGNGADKADLTITNPDGGAGTLSQAIQN